MAENKGLTFYIASTGLVLLILTLVYFSIVSIGGANYSELSVFGRVLVFTGLVGGFAFWFSMLAHFFKNTKIKNKAIWGFSLIFFWWIASLLYFFIHFFPKKQAPSKGFF